MAVREIMQLDEVVLGRYAIQDILGIGGQGAVAKGVDQTTGQPVAIKQLLASRDDSNYATERARFQRGSDIRVHYPVVVVPLDSGEDAGEFYVITPYIDGPALQDHVNHQGGKLSTDDAVSITKDLAGGLGALHDRGYVHRDINTAALD